MFENLIKMIIDVHAHLDMIPKDSLDGVMARAKEQNVGIIVANGFDSVSNKFVLDITKKYASVRPALGIYPTYVTKEIDSDIEFISKNNPSAIGEVGMDYKEEEWQSDEKKKLQRECFFKFLELAKKKSIPIIVHSRKAESDVIDVIESSSIKPNKVIMHCFSGKFSLVRKIRDNGWNFSIPTNIVNNEHFQKLVSEVNLSQLFTETDTPFLSPFKINQKLIDEKSEFDINEPSNIRFTISKIAEIKKMDKIEVENNIQMNYQKNFC